MIVDPTDKAPDLFNIEGNLRLVSGVTPLDKRSGTGGWTRTY
jgi:hypothetical protein